MNEPVEGAGNELYLPVEELRACLPNHPHRATLGRWVRKGIFPAPVRFGPRKIAWKKSEVDAWLKSGGIDWTF